MVSVGVRPAEAKDSMVRLNVGGFHVVVPRTTLTVPSEFGEIVVLGSLFQGE